MRMQETHHLHFFLHREGQRYCARVRPWTHTPRHISSEYRGYARTNMHKHAQRNAQAGMNTYTMIQHHTTPYNTIQHHTTPYNTIQHYTTPYNTIQHHTTSCNTIQHNTTPYNTIQQHKTPYNAIQHHTTPYNTIQ